MLVFDDIKLIYLANPKTGTTAFQRAFMPYANKKLSQSLPKHVPFRRVMKLLPEIADTYEAVTCVRDPLETLYSWYRYRQRPNIKDIERSTQGMSFAEFLTDWCNHHPAKYVAIGTGCDFVYDDTGVVPANLKLFRYEATPTIIDYVAAKRGKKIAVKSKNVSPPVKSEELEAARQSPLMQSKRMSDEYRRYSALKFENDTSA